MDFLLSKYKGISKIGQFISNVVVPVLPVIIGNCLLSLLIGIMSVLRFPVIAPNIYRIIALFNGEISILIMFLIGTSACKRLNSRVIPGLVIVAAFLYPALDELSISLPIVLSDPMTISGIQLAILPLLLEIYIYSRTTQWIMHINPLPRIGKLLPYLSMGVVISITWLFIYPLGRFLDDLFRVGILCIFLTVPMIGSIILGLLSPILCLMGFLFGDFPMTVSFWQLKDAGFILGPSLLSACICQGTAALCVSVKEKEKSLRQREVVCGILGFFAFLMPPLLAVNLRHTKVLAAGLAGSFSSGIYYGLFRVIRVNNSIHLFVGLLIGTAVTIYAAQLFQTETEDEFHPSLQEQDSLTNLKQKYKIK